MDIRSFILNRLREGSTVRFLVLAASWLGIEISLDPEQAQAVDAAIMAIIAALAAFIPDRLGK